VQKRQVVAEVFCMKGVILAAGDGGRLYELTRTCPKVLLPMEGRALISYSLESMTAAGITAIAVVVGHNGAMVEQEVRRIAQDVERLEFITNVDFLGGNALSVHAAQAFTQNEDFVLCMGDHIIDRDLVGRLLQDGPSVPVLCVDSEPSLESQINDATRVLRGPTGCIEEIGKDLERWNAVDTGVFLLGGVIFSAIEGLIPEHGIHVELSQAVRRVIADGVSFATCDISGLFWTDVDTLEDYEGAARYMASLGGHDNDHSV